jgi:hypothetical protein
MYQQIKQLADEALALQNKDRMDAALREISALCVNDSDGVSIPDGISPKMLWPAAKQFFDARYPVDDAASSFSLAHVKQQGCAVHPDDISAPMSDKQEARQLAAYERDVAAGGPVSAGEGGDQ